MAKSLKEIVEQKYPNSKGRPAHTLMEILDRTSSSDHGTLEHRPPEEPPRTPDGDKPTTLGPKTTRKPGGYSY